jgi:hypothetical protein
MAEPILATARDGDDPFDLDLEGVDFTTTGIEFGAFTNGASAVDSLARRVRALACTAPLHALEANKTRVADARWTRLNCWELAFVAIDAVAVAMDFDTGASYEQIVDVVARQAGRHDPTLTDADREAAATWIVEGLISGRGGAEAFTATYGHWDDLGEYRALGYHVQLLSEHAGTEGNIFLRASDQAINVLVGALDTDIASAADAADAKLDSLVQRGLWNEAVHAAEIARYRSIQYADLIRREVVATRQNVADVDWAERVPALIERSLEHVLRRYRTERRIMDNIARSRDEATEPNLRAKASALLNLLKDCQARHQTLHRRLLSVREEFREATRELLGRPPATVSLVDLERQILVPLLSSPVRYASPPLEAFFTRLSPPTPTPAPDLVRLVDILCSPPRVEDLHGDPLEAPTLTDVSGDPRFTDSTWDAAEEILDDCDRPTRLSALIARAEAAGAHSGDVAHLIALLAMRAVDPGLGHYVTTDVDGARLLAVDDGTPIAHPRFAGSDLLLAPFTTRAPEEEMAAR